MKKKLLLPVFVFSFALLFQGCNKDVQIESESINIDLKSEVSDPFALLNDGHQQEANNKLAKLKHSYGHKKSRSGYSTFNYPDYYGGAHIKADGTLVVQIVGDLESGKKAISDIIGNSNIEFESVKYSYAYLDNLMDELALFKKQNRNTLPALNNIASFASGGVANHIELRLVELSDEKIASLKNTPFNNPAIKIVKGERIKNEATASPGGKISSAAVSGGINASIAFPAKNSSGQSGIVTCAHGWQLGDNAYIDGEHVRTVTQWQNGAGGNIDASFITVPDPITHFLSNQVDGTTDNLSTFTSSPAAGTIIRFRGHVSGSQSGTVTNDNVILDDDDGNTYNLTEANYNSDDGDSGGIVYSYVTAEDRFYTVGVHKGSGGGFAYFSKAEYVLYDLNLTRM